MNNVCKISSPQEFINNFMGYIRELNSTNESEDIIKYLYLKKLKSFKTQYYAQSTVDEFSNIVRKLINSSLDIMEIMEENGVLNSILSKDYSEELVTQDPRFVESTLDSESKTDKLDSTPSELKEDNAIIEGIIGKYFPMATDARLAFEQQFRNQLILSFFYNDSGVPRINISNKDMDLAIKLLRLKLVEDLDNYIQKKLPEKYPVFSKFIIESKLEYFKGLIDSPFFNINSVDLVKIPVIESLSDDNPLKLKLKAYMAYIALNHFDEMVLQAFGSSIYINYMGNYNIDEVKYRINLGDQNRQSWGSEDEADSTEEIGGIIRLFMESLDMYNLNGKVLPYKMTFTDVKSGFGAIMNLFNSNTSVLNPNLSRNIKISEYLGGREFKHMLQGEYYDEKEKVWKKSELSISDFYGEGWDEIYNTYLRDKTLGLLIASAKNKPALLMPLLFTVLAKNANLFFPNRYLEKQAVYSIWENLFNMNNKYSLILRTRNTGGINIDGLDLYSFVSTLFVNIENIPVIEYRNEQGRNSLVTLRQNTSNSKLNNQKYIWEAKYNVKYPQQFKTFTIDDFEKDSNSTTVKIKNSSKSLKLSGGDNVSVVIADEKSDVDLNTLSSDLEEFLSEVFDVPINAEFFEIYKDLGGSLKDLIEIAGNILYNYKVGKTINQEISQNKDEVARKVYDLNITKYLSSSTMMRGLMLPELINRSIFPKIRTFSLVLDILQGYSKETTGKDGEGKQVALVGLSCLASKYMELVYNHNLGNPNSIIKDFNIYDTFEDVEFMRDFAGTDKKQATTFSEEEFFYANFLLDFYGGQVSATKEEGQFNRLGTKEGSTPELPTKFRIIGPVVSDKSKLPKIRFDWRSEVKFPDGTTKKYYELTTDEIYQIQEYEFGRYYRAVYDRIHLDLQNIAPYVLKIIDRLQNQINPNLPAPQVELDFDNDYEYFSNLCKSFNENPERLLHQALVEYLAEARQNGLRDDGIKIIKGVHYLKGMHNNPALFHQLNIYNQGVPYKIRKQSIARNDNGEIIDKGYLPNLDLDTLNETPELARTRLNLQLVSELLQNDVEITLGEVDDAATWAAKLYNENKVWRNGRHIIFGKIIEKGKTIKDLSRLRDFQSWNEYQNLLELFGGFIPERYNVTNPKFDLRATIEAINTIKKYNVFKFKEVNEYLLNDYINEGLGLTRPIEEIISEELHKKYPNWKPETVERKTLEQVASMSEAEIIVKKAQYQLNWDIEMSILDTIDPSLFTETYFDYEEKLNEIAKYLYYNQGDSDSEIDAETANKIFNRIQNPVEYQILLNPEIERYQALNNWLGESYQLTSVGTFIAHPGDANASTIYNYEYRMFGQQVKRNVSQTALKHREVQNSTKGIRSRVRIAIMTDDEDSFITFKGDFGTNVEVHNGATFYNGSMVDLDNNSLGADAMGLDKKPFIHAIDPETGIAIIIKTAGFAVANSYIQKSPIFARINRKMNDTIKWSDTLRRIGSDSLYFNWLEDFKGGNLNIDPIYVNIDGQWYKRSNFRFDSTTGRTSYLQEAVATNGEVLNLRTNGELSEIIDSNWQLWNLFGGAYSGHFDSNGKLSYINDEGSFKLLNYVMNHTGIVKNRNIPVWDQTNVIQVVKESQIDMMPTTEAVKFGAGNINDVKGMLYDDDYVPTYMEIFSDDLGEQLDAEHTAEGGHVSLMTQVINALGARGFSTKDAEECYRALELLAEQSFEEAFEDLINLNKKPSNTSAKEAFKTAIANIMLSSLKNVSLSDGNILSAIALGLKRFLKFGNVKDLESFPISSPQIYANLFSKLASTLEKAAIRLKFDGGMLVLNPSNGMFLIINGKLLGTVSNQEAKRLQKESFNNPIIKSSDVQFGHKYYICSQTDTGFILSEPKLIDTLSDFYEVIDYLNSGALIIEAYCEGVTLSPDGVLDITGESNPIGRDLATYGCTIKESNSDRTFSLWETDVVKQLFGWNEKSKRFVRTKNTQNVPFTILEELWNRYLSGENIRELLLLELNKFGITEINPDMMHSYLERAFLDVLNSISSGIRKTVLINGEEINIDKHGTTVSPYEAILPMIYKTSFGLRDGDSVGEIEQDKYFFVKRFIDNSKSKLSNDSEFFDLELKKTSGKHLYVAHSSRDMGFNLKVDLLTEIYGEALYRLDPKTHKRMYQIPFKVDEQTGQLVENCEIYKTFNGTEIIRTDDIAFMLDLGEYTSISFGDLSLISLENAKKVLLALEQSKNKVARRKAEYVINAAKEKANRNIEGILKGDTNYTLAIPAEIQTEILLNSPILDEILTLNDVFNNQITENALIAHLLFTLDALNQLELLNELEIALEDPTKLNEFLLKNPHMRGIIDYGVEQHTSFLASLLAVVSRTPAQSHQSFMAMKVVGFDTNVTNSIYVSRMQLYLQGSDYALK